MVFKEYTKKCQIVRFLIAEELDHMLYYNCYGSKNGLFVLKFAKELSINIDPAIIQVAEQKNHYLTKGENSERGV